MTEGRTLIEKVRELVTECCGRPIDGSDRYCPRCGQECRVLQHLTGTAEQVRVEEAARELLAAARGFLVMMKAECASLLADNCDIDRLDTAMARMDFRLSEVGHLTGTGWQPIETAPKELKTLRDGVRSGDPLQQAPAGSSGE